MVIAIFKFAIPHLEEAATPLYERGRGSAAIRGWFVPKKQGAAGQGPRNPPGLFRGAASRGEARLELYPPERPRSRVKHSKIPNLGVRRDAARSRRRALLAPPHMGSVFHGRISAASRAAGPASPPASVSSGSEEQNLPEPNTFLPLMLHLGFVPA